MDRSVTKSWSLFFDEISSSDGFPRFKAGLVMAIDDGFSARIRDAILDSVSSSTFLEKIDAAICPGSKDQDWRFIWTRKLTQMVFANALALNHKMQITDHLDRATYIVPVVLLLLLILF